MALSEQIPRMQRFGLRAALLRIHSDLFQVHRLVDQYSIYDPPELTNLETLVLVLEDRRFMHHAGVDGLALAREFGRAVTFREHGGASTIDMQFVRTATGYRERTLTRKLYEMLLALLIQYRYSKIVILRSYLNHAFFGSRLIGAERTAKELYGVSHHDLSLVQASTLAAALVYPRPLAPQDAWLNNVRRRSSYGMRIYLANKQRFDQLHR